MQLEVIVSKSRYSGLFSHQNGFHSSIAVEREDMQLVDAPLTRTFDGTLMVGAYVDGLKPFSEMLSLSI